MPPTISTDKSDHKTVNTSIVALALGVYEQENQAGFTGIDMEFRTQAITQRKTFLFVGHGTSSSTTAYAYHLLSLNPDVLRRIRQEHGNILGTDVFQAQMLFKRDLHLSTRMQYTLAVIEEVLWMYLAGSSTHNGECGFYIDFDGKHTPQRTL